MYQGRQGENQTIDQYRILGVDRHYQEEWPDRRGVVEVPCCPFRRYTSAVEDIIALKYISEASFTDHSTHQSCNTD